MSIDTTIQILGKGAIRSPLPLDTEPGNLIGTFTDDATRVRYNVEVDGHEDRPELLFEKAGPRETIYYDPAETKVAIMTCGGVCPGLNNVIRSAYRELSNYGVREVLGIRYGHQGLNPAVGLEPLRLTDELVNTIHQHGGTLLGSSRGSQPLPVMVDTLKKWGVQVLLTVGGDGTQRGARDIGAEARKQGYPLSVVGVPKTIDNDIQFVRRTFGFTTAADKAREVLTCAHVEARAYPNGVVIVRLMGRDSGFIAAAAALASQEANFVLVPEVPFKLEGENGLFNALKRRLERKDHAVIAVAEGAGQDLLAALPRQTDASGNVLHHDIGLHLRDQIAAHFKEQKIGISLKYIDPSYIIRSVPANSEDAVLCDQFARHAVHAAMAGKTDLVIGFWNEFIHVPIALATAQRRKIEPDSLLWSSVLSATGQPAQME